MNDSSSADLSWVARNEFLVRRLHSLSGLIPVGAYMVVHLLTNASVLDSPATFQANVYRIHSLGRLLPVVEWGFIFLPILFHAIFGVIIIRGGLPNSSSYPISGNIRYTLQRATGMIAFLFIMWHVFHMHGWFHFETWLNKVATPLDGAKFRPYNAASSLGVAMQQSIIVPILYAIGILSCVFHLANGIWTMGITWGLWVSPVAQKRANYVCSFFGVGLAVLGLSALYGASTVNVDQALESERKMYDARVAADELTPTHDEHKRWTEQQQEELEEGESDTQGQTETEPVGSLSGPHSADLR